MLGATVRKAFLGVVGAATLTVYSAGSAQAVVLSTQTPPFEVGDSFTVRLFGTGNPLTEVVDLASTGLGINSVYLVEFGCNPSDCEVSVGSDSDSNLGDDAMGALAVANLAGNTVTFSVGGNSNANRSVTFQAVVTPLPAAGGLLAAGLVGLAWLRRRRAAAA